MKSGNWIVSYGAQGSFQAAKPTQFSFGYHGNVIERNRAGRERSRAGISLVYRRALQFYQLCILVMMVSHVVHSPIVRSTLRHDIGTMREQKHKNRLEHN